MIRFRAKGSLHGRKATAHSVLAHPRLRGLSLISIIKRSITVGRHFGRSFWSFSTSTESHTTLVTCSDFSRPLHGLHLHFATDPTDESVGYFHSSAARPNSLVQLFPRPRSGRSKIA